MLFSDNAQIIRRGGDFQAKFLWRAILQKKVEDHCTRLTTLLLADNREATWNKAIISYKRCACPWTIWI